MSAAERIRFLDAAPPALPAGEFELAVEQRVALPAPHASPAPYRVTRRLRVTGPRFALAPGDVASVFPAAGSEGTYDEVLPHVVLSRRTLPWEVAMPGGVPWLAVLVLAPDEIVTGPDTGPTGARPVELEAEYLRLARPGITGPVPDADRARDVPSPDPQSSAPARCLVVDVAADAFGAIAPGLDELSWLAHVREVDLAEQTSAPQPTDEWFSVVVANRMPDSRHGSTWCAHVVSLDGHASHLPGGSAVATGGAVRLLSLASWAFRTDTDRASFAALMGRVAANVGTMAPSRLAHQTRDGTPAIATYGGPLVAADGISVPVARELGRLLTIANRNAAGALAGWMQRSCAAAQAHAAPAPEPQADAARAVAAELVADAPLGATDPVGLEGREHRLPGVLDPAARAVAVAAAPDPTAAVAAAVLGGDG